VITSHFFGMLFYGAHSATILAQANAGHAAVLGGVPAPGEDHPFPHSDITTDRGKKLRPEDWQDPQIFAGGHPRQFSGWDGPMHSNVFKDPVFQALWAFGDEGTDGATTNHCGGCREV